MNAGTRAWAALDVLASEPLPLLNVIVTPRIGGFWDIYHQQPLHIMIRRPMRCR